MARIVPLLVATIALAALALRAAEAPTQPTPAAAKTGSRHAATSAAKADKHLVHVFVFDGDGKLVGPVESPKLVLTNSQWRHRLTAEQFKVLRAKDTERAFCGNLIDNHKDGVYTCAGCGLPLFASSSKFNSGTGWPSFNRAIAKDNIETHRDLSDGTTRLEIHCARCNGHLGHVFDDGPAPTGLRFCLNSAALNFTDQHDLAKLADPAAEDLASGTSRPQAPASDARIEHEDSKSAAREGARKDATPEQAVFAGGCFWCTEAVFEQLKGVTDVESGYCGGGPSTAHYDAVHQGTTRHAETIRVTYNPDKISYDQLLDVFFDAHDPTQMNRQGEDEGRQYRSAIFFANDEQKAKATAKIAALREKKTYAKRIVTRLEPLVMFYPAEAIHQDFAAKYPFDGYIQEHAIPQACKIQIKHPELIEHAQQPPSSGLNAARQ